VRRCREVRRPILGLDGFWIRMDGRYQIDQEQCLDVSRLPPEATWHVASDFIEARIALPLAFEFVLQDPNGADSP
jgi:hypothetical protein